LTGKKRPAEALIARGPAAAASAAADEQWKDF
jgi:hypothetical protein